MSPARNTAFALAMQVISGVITAGLTLFLVRKLGPHGYGVLALAISIGAVAFIVGDFGVGQSVARFTAERRGDRISVAGVMISGLKLKVVAALVFCGAMFALAEPIANAYDTSALAAPIRLTAVAVFAQALGALCVNMFEALGRLSLAFRYILSESVVEAGATVALVLLGGGAAGAAGGRAIGFSVALIVGFVLTVRLVKPAAIRAAVGAAGPTVGPGLMRIFRYGAALVIVDGAITLFNRIDVLIIGAYLGADSAGLFEAPLRILTFLSYGGVAIAAGFAPRLARVGGAEPEAEQFWRALRVLLLLQLLIAAPVLVWAEPVTDVALGSSFGGSADVFRALSLFIIMSGLGPLLATGVNYLGEARRRIPLAIGAVLINLVIDLVLVPEIGIVAGAIGTTAAYGFYIAGHLAICRADIGMPTRALAATLGRGLLAAGAASAVLFAFGTSDLAPWAWVGGTIGATLAFLGTLLLTREIHPSQMRAAIRLSATRLRALRPRNAEVDSGPGG